MPSHAVDPAVVSIALRAAAGAARRSGRALLAPLLASLVASCAATVEQRSFANPEDAANAFVDALRAEDDAALIEIFGPDAAELIDSGDRVADRAGRQRFLDAFDERRVLEESADGAVVVIRVGELDWPFPIPIVSDEDGWFFDTEAGADEVLSRRIGRNELSAIQTCLAVVDAERDYAGADRDGDGILEYARKVPSSAGAMDGLYWETGEDEPPSPLGELVAAAVKEGYANGGESGGDSGPRPFHGYLFRILEAQGPNARGGAYEYVVRENMIGGFAVVAYPARYGFSGIKTFTVNHDGAVYEKDLGDDTAEIAGAMKAFDPDPTWEKTDPAAAEPIEPIE